jgi:hypothetical protein
MRLVESKSDERLFFALGVLKSAALLSSSRVTTKAATFTLVENVDDPNTWSDLVVNTSRVS